ncbi:MAG: hypothetical protein U0787_16015 [Polyangia bacterium]
MAHKQDPSSSLTTLQNAGKVSGAQSARCDVPDDFGAGGMGEGGLCDAAEAQAMPLLQAALAKATLATQSPETYPDACRCWRSPSAALGATKPARQLRAIRRLATDGVCAKPQSPLGHATRGQLLLLWAQRTKTRCKNAIMPSPRPKNWSERSGKMRCSRCGC